MIGDPALAGGLD